jgi:hypothetical protein
VGYYKDQKSAGHGFAYNGSTFTAINDPMGSDTSATGISGNAIVGTYQDSNFVTQGFVYNGSELKRGHHWELGTGN